MPNPSQRELGPAEFWFRILARRPRATSDDMLGFTELDERLGTGLLRSILIRLRSRRRKNTIVTSFKCSTRRLRMRSVICSSAQTLILILAWMCPHWGRTQFELISISESIFTADQSKRLRHQIIAKSGNRDPGDEDRRCSWHGQSPRFP